MSKLPSSVDTSNKDSVKQTIDLTEYAGDAILDRPDIVQSIAQDLIDLQVSRTERGKDVNGNGLAKYSDDYKESDEFKAYGKTNKVNMTLSGGMLADIDILNLNPVNLVIGFDDVEESNKAHGHLTGMRDNKQIPTKSKPAPRLFFGVTSEDIQKVVDQYNIEESPVFDFESDIFSSGVETTFEDILGSIFGEG